MIIKNNTKPWNIDGFSDREYIFSCIIAIYNVGNYLKETIDSVINQTLNFNKYVQLILVNDGSLDNSEDICLSYEKKYPDNIFYIKKKNGGVSSARNLGLKYAIGEYVNFIDGDDYFTLNSLNMVNYFFNKNKDVDFVTIEMLNFGERFSLKKSLYFRFYENSHIVEINKERNFAIFSPGMIFIKNQCAKKYKFDEKIRIGEDVHYLYKIVIDNPKCGVVKNEKYMHRIRENSASGSPRRLEDTKKLLDVVLLDLLKHSSKKNKNRYVDQFVCELVLNIIDFEVINKVLNQKQSVLLSIVRKIKKCLDYISYKNIKSSIFICEDSIKKFIFIKKKSPNIALKVFLEPFSISMTDNFLKRVIFLFKNDRIKMKGIISYKLKNHDKILYLLKTLFRFFKKILHIEYKRKIKDCILIFFYKIDKLVPKKIRKKMKGKLAKFNFVKKYLLK